MKDDTNLRKVDMSQWNEIGQLRAFAAQEGYAKRIKLISGYGGVGRAYWRAWGAEDWEPFGPTEVFATAVVQ